MKLFFTPEEILKQDIGLTFDDVLIAPNYSTVGSRQDPKLKLKTLFSRNIKLEIPIVSANMDTITGARMAIEMDKMGGLGIIHRFMSIEKMERQIRKMKRAGLKNIAVSVGVGKEERKRAKMAIKVGANIITVDIAHGHMERMLDMIKWLKDRFPKIEILAGNIATGQAAYDLIKVGADAIKVGVGPGSMCKTRIVAGVGVPQLTAIEDCAQVCIEYGVPAGADGGNRFSGDIVKALAAGANWVMLGSMLKGIIETPGKIENGMKKYRGMASKDAQISWRGKLAKGMAPEGEVMFVRLKAASKIIFRKFSEVLEAA